jgi:hypothetical protein
MSEKWVQYTDEQSGSPYWYNNETGETSWEPQETEWNEDCGSDWNSEVGTDGEWNEKAQGGEWAEPTRQEYRLPPGWTKEWDETNQLHYYTNPELGITQWEAPELVELTESNLAAHTGTESKTVGSLARKRWKSAFFKLQMVKQFRDVGPQIPFSDTDSSGDGWVSEDSFDSLPGRLKPDRGDFSNEKGRSNKHKVVKEYKKVREQLMESDKGRHILEIEQGKKIQRPQEMDAATMNLINAMMAGDVHEMGGYEQEGGFGDGMGGVGYDQGMGYDQGGVVDHFDQFGYESTASGVGSSAKDGSSDGGSNPLEEEKEEEEEEEEEVGEEDVFALAKEGGGGKEGNYERTELDDKLDQAQQDLTRMREEAQNKRDRTASRRNDRKKTALEVKTVKNLTLDKLDEIAFLGAGSFGNVTLVALKSDRSQTFALKAVSKESQVREKMLPHLLMEKKALLACRHQFICHLHGTCQDVNLVYFVMEVVEGPDLHHIIQHPQATAPNYPNAGLVTKQCKFYGACILSALHHMQERHVVHRDMKPLNCVVGIDGYIKLIDYGLAAVLAKGKKARTVCGTRYYFAPEMIKRKGGYGTSVDVWAFGVMLYEMYVGWTPFMAKSYKVKKPQMEQEILKCESDGIIPYDRTDPDFPQKVSIHEAASC